MAAPTSNPDLPKPTLGTYPSASKAEMITRFMTFHPEWADDEDTRRQAGVANAAFDRALARIRFLARKDFRLNAKLTPVLMGRTPGAPVYWDVEVEYRGRQSTVQVHLPGQALRGDIHPPTPGQILDTIIKLLKDTRDDESAPYGHLTDLFPIPMYLLFLEG